MTPAPRAYNSMITRCPSCAAQVSEEAERCPSCQWDFAAKSRGGAAGKPPAAAPRGGVVPAPPPPIVPPPPSSKAETGQGLKQLPKIEGLKKNQAKLDDAPFALPTFEQPEPVKPAPAAAPGAGSGFGLPPAKSLPRTPEPATAPDKPAVPLLSDTASDGPPVTEIRSAPQAAPRAEAQPPAPLPGRAPEATKPKPRGGGLPWMAAAAALLTVAGYGAFKLVTQSSDTEGGKLSGQLRFTEGSDTVRLDPARLMSAAQSAVSAPEPQRDIRQIQRAVVDPGNPNMVIRVPQGALIPQPTGGGPSSPPAASAPMPPLIPPPAPPKPAAPLAKAPAPPPPAPAPAASLPMHKSAAQAPGKPLEIAELAVPISSPKPALWVFEGQIYDLLTLLPVFDAEVRLLDASGKVVASASTADGGRYRLSVEAARQGYRVSVLHPDYQDKLLDEIVPPYKDVDRRSRLLAASVGASQRPWMGLAAGPVRRDFVMVPKVLPER